MTSEVGITIKDAIRTFDEGKSIRRLIERSRRRENWGDKIETYCINIILKNLSKFPTNIVSEEAVVESPFGTRQSSANRGIAHDALAQRPTRFVDRMAMGEISKEGKAKVIPEIHFRAIITIPMAGSDERNLSSNLALIKTLYSISESSLNLRLAGRARVEEVGREVILLVEVPGGLQQFFLPPNAGEEKVFAFIEEILTKKVFEPVEKIDLTRFATSEAFKEIVSGPSRSSADSISVDIFSLYGWSKERFGPELLGGDDLSGRIFFFPWYGEWLTSNNSVGGA